MHNKIDDQRLQRVRQSLEDYVEKTPGTHKLHALMTTALTMRFDLIANNKLRHQFLKK